MEKEKKFIADHQDLLNIINRKVKVKLSNEQIVFLEEYRRLKHHKTLSESVNVIIDDAIDLFIDLKLTVAMNQDI